MSRRWRIETALKPRCMRERGIASARRAGQPPASRAREPQLARAGGRGPAQQRNLLLPRPRCRSTCCSATRAAELARAPRARQAAVDLVGGLLDRAGALFAGDAVRRASRSAGAAGRSTSSAPTFRPPAIDRARAGRYTQFEVQRGLPITQMIRWFEERRRRLARIDRAAPAGPLPGPQPARAAAASGRFDIILCRNVLLYFSRRDATRWCSSGWPRRCAPDGVLVLGAGETVIGQTDRFVAELDASRALPLTGDGSRVKAPARPAACPRLDRCADAAAR